MGHRNVILLALATICYGDFAFNDLNVVLNFAIDVSKAYQCGCITVLRPSGSSQADNAALTDLTRSLAKQEGIKFQAMAYPLEWYLARYLSEQQIYAGTCFKWVTIVMITNTTYFQLQQLVQTHIFSSSLWLLFANGSNVEIFNKVNIWYDSWVWLLQPETSKTLSITEVYRVREGFDMIWLPVGEWSQDDGLEMYEIDRGRLDLQGVQFRAGAHEDWPITSFTHGTAGIIREVDGYFPSVWFDFEQILNFTTIIVRATDGTPGSHISGGNWSGLIGQSVRGEIDVILSEMDLTVNRLDAIKHLTPLLRNQFQIFFPVNGYILDYFSAFYPFHSLVWVVIYAWIFFGAAVLYMTCKIAKRVGLEDSYEISPLGSVFFILQSLCQQGSSTVPKIWAERVLFIVSYLLAAVILPSYSAALISSLTMKTPNKPFDSLEGILNTNYKLIIPANSSYYDYFAKSTNPVLSKIFEKHTHENSTMAYDIFVVTKFLCENQNIALFTHATYADQDLHQMGVPDICELQSLSRPLSSIYQSIAFPKYSPYHKTFNKIILRMMEVGLVNRQKLRYIPNYQKLPPRPDIPLKLIDVASIFLFFVLALGISILILAIELRNCFPHGRQREQLMM